MPNDATSPSFALPLAFALGLLAAALAAGWWRQVREARRLRALTQRTAAFYAALSQTSASMRNVRDAQALYDDICRICVETGHALLASVYLREGSGEDEAVRRVADAGAALRVLEGFPNPWSLATPEARSSYTSQSLLDGVTLVSNDYQHDPRTAAWRARALAHGVHAIAWLPLRREGRVVGVLMLGAGEPGYFDEQLVALLENLTGDISFALDMLEREAARRRASREAVSALERFRLLFHAAPLPTLIIGRDAQRIVDINDVACQLLRQRRAELIGRSTDALERRTVPEDRAQFYREMRHERRVRNMLVRSDDGSGRLRHELVNAAEIDYLGEPCYLVILLDISELHAAEEARQALAAAEADNRAKSEFLSHMSHELRTPLNAVLGFSDLLRRRAPGPLAPAEMAQLDHIHRAGWHLLSLVNDVLDVSRIETGSLGVESYAIELAPLLDEVVQMSQPHAARCGVVLARADAMPGRTGVLADATRLRQVVLNLISNAIKYNRPGGSVRVGATVQGEQVRIEVRDDGLGMTQEQLLHLYEPFNRLGRERGRIEGSGIGLTLSRQLVSLMGGSLDISSRSGEGTRAVVGLPCVAIEAQEARLSQFATEPAGLDLPHGAAGVVLYVEDNEVNTLLVEQMLAVWPDLRFVPAADGASGIRLAHTLRPDLVLLDMQLPDMDGFEVLQALRADPALRRLPVVALSANAAPDDVQRARTLGVTDYWTKPLEHDRFLRGIARLLRDGEAQAA